MNRAIDCVALIKKETSSKSQGVDATKVNRLFGRVLWRRAKTTSVRRLSARARPSLASNNVRRRDRDDGGLRSPVAERPPVCAARLKKKCKDSTHLSVTRRRWNCNSLEVGFPGRAQTFRWSGHRDRCSPGPRISQREFHIGPRVDGHASGKGKRLSSGERVLRRV
jgi:hypothetical protein